MKGEGGEEGNHLHPHNSPSRSHVLMLLLITDEMKDSSEKIAQGEQGKMNENGRNLRANTTMGDTRNNIKP